MTVLTIIGAGWLGSSLATYLDTKHTVYASRRTQKNVDELQKNGINGFVCDLASQEQPLADILIQQNTNIVVGSFPPGVRKGLGHEYVDYWQYLIDACQQASVKKIIMISSTSVYPDTSDIMTEESASLTLAQSDDSFSEKSKTLLQAEELVKMSGIDFCILRMSGLVGPKRHPARFVGKLKQLSTLAPANIVHLIDAVKSINFAIYNLRNDIINVTTPYTVSKAEFYKYALSQSDYDFQLPEIVSIEDKGVVSDKLQNAGYQFHFSTTYQVIDDINEYP